MVQRTPLLLRQNPNLCILLPRSICVHISGLYISGQINWNIVCNGIEIQSGNKTLPVVKPFCNVKNISIILWRAIKSRMIWNCVANFTVRNKYCGY